MRIHIKNDNDIEEILHEVYAALSEKGLNPVMQIVGYLLSDDPTYITSYGGARSKIVQFDRNEILEELMRAYSDSINKENYTKGR